MSFEQTLQEAIITALNTEAGQLALEQALKKALQTNKQETTPNFLNKNKAAVYLGRSVKTLDYYVLQAQKKKSKNPIPFHQPFGKGSAIYFDKNELTLWLQKKKIRNY